MKNIIEWEIQLEAPEAFVIVEASEDATEEQLLELACRELTSRTYIYSKKRITT